MQGKKCCCPCHKMMSILVILFGLVFLLGTLEVLSAHFVSIAWPSIIILAGIKCMVAGCCKCCSGESASNKDSCCS